MKSFLNRQFEDAVALVQQSDLVQLLPFPGGPFPPDRYIARFLCKGLVRAADGTITEAECFDVGIYFPEDYLRKAEPSRVLTWLHPANVWHPNILGPAHVICIGHMAPGTPLIDLLYQVYEIITYRKVTMREDDALNRECCPWARQNVARLPIDTRPLKRQTVELAIAVHEGQPRA